MGCLELCCRVSVFDYMVHCVVSSRLVDEGCTGDHASLVTVFNVLGQVQQLAGAWLLGPETDLLLD